MSFNTVDKIALVQQVVEGLDQDYSPDCPSASENPHLTQQEDTQRGPRLHFSDRSASMAQNTSKIHWPTKQQWDSQKELIRELYVHRRFEVQQVKDFLLREQGFKTSMRQLKYKIKFWGMAKNITSSQWPFIVKKGKQRMNVGEETTFYIGGSKVSRGKVNNSARQKDEQDLDANFTGAVTPKGFSCYTPSPEPEPEPGPESQPGQQQSINPATGFVPHLSPHSPNAPNEYGAQQLSTESLCFTEDISWDDDQFYKPSTSSNCLSVSSSNRQSLGEDLQENDVITLEDEVPSTDSGYKSAPNLYNSLNSQPFITDCAHPFNFNSAAMEGSENDDVKTTYSIGSTVGPDYARNYITELCSDIFSKLRKSVDTTNWSTLTKALPELIKAFALGLCQDSTSQNSQMSRNIMYFVHKRHKEVIAQLEVMFNIGDEDEPDRDRDRLDDMSVQEKMDMWGSKAEQDHSVLSNNKLFEGVQDDDKEDPIEQSELSEYHKIILDSTAYEWLLRNVATEAIIESEMSPPRIRQHLLDKLPTGTVSRSRAPNVYEVIFGFEWHRAMEDRVQYELLDELRRPSRASIIMAGSPNHAQGLSIKQYLAQTWPMTGLKLLAALKKAITHPTKTSYASLPGNSQLMIRILPSHLAVSVMGPAYSVADCGELLAWMGSALLSGTKHINHSCLPLITDFRVNALSPSSALVKYKGYCSIKFELTQRGTTNESLLRIQQFSRDLIGENNIILGFPIRRRPEGYPGIEVSFDMLLNFLQMSKTEIFTFDGFIKGPERMLKLVKHIDNIFLWRVVHSLADYSSCCPEQLDKTIAIEDCSSLDYYTLETGRHILSQCTNNHAPTDDHYLLSDEPMVDTRAAKSNIFLNLDQVDNLNLSSHCQVVVGNHPQPQDDGIASRSPIIGLDDSLSENCPLSPYAENRECSGLISDDSSMFTADCQVSPKTASREDSLDSDMFSISDSAEDIDFLDCEEGMNLILNNLFHQLLANFRTATEYQSSPGAGEAAPGAITSTTESTHTRPTSRLDLKRKSPPDEEDEAGEDGSRRPFQKKMKADKGDEELEKSFACPFLKWNPLKYSRCCVKKLSSISYIKQHLHRKHTPERYCQTCHSTDFPDDDKLQSHINIGICTCRDRTMLDGISYQQRFKLSRKSKAKSSKEDQWYAIWEILFPGDRRPSSIYVDTELPLEMRPFRAYCERYGPVIIREHIGPSLSGGTAEQRRVLDRLIARGLDKLFDNWSSRNSSTSTGSERHSNDNPEQSGNETPANSFVDSGVAMGSESSQTESRSQSTRPAPPSMIPVVSSTAWSVVNGTEARSSELAHEAPVDMQRLVSAPVNFATDDRDWETEYQGNEYEAVRHAAFERHFDFGAFPSPEDMLSYFPQPDHTYKNGGPSSEG